MKDHDKKTILMFDDDLALLELAFLLFEEELYSVAVCASSDNVIQKVDEIRPHLIFMDNWIPTIGGVEATKLLKLHPEFSCIPVIYMTADNNIKNLALSAKADDFLIKPFSIEDIEMITSKHLNIYC